MFEIAETVGFDAAVVLMDNFGGIGSFYIPRVALERHKIARLIGFENYKKRDLCFKWRYFFFHRFKQIKAKWK